MSDHVWPEHLTLRDTKIHADEGQRIYTTATGYGYEKCEYVRADASSQAEIERLRAALTEARRYVAYLAGDDRTFVGSGMPSECLALIDAALSGSKE